jgi:hypothetical protein
MVYEVRPTGYGLARRALVEGIELGVCAPSKTERPPADWAKTDKRDAGRPEWRVEQRIGVIPSLAWALWLPHQKNVPVALVCG